MEAPNIIIFPGPRAAGGRSFGLAGIPAISTQYLAELVAEAIEQVLDLEPDSILVVEAGQC